MLQRLRNDSDSHSSTLHKYLSVVSSYLFGYRDSPTCGSLDDQFESNLLTAKIVLERELLDHWLQAAPAPVGLDQRDLAEYLRSLSADNRALRHPLFEYLRDDAPRAVLTTFLRNEVARNEVVDDEVSMLIPGIQGPMKLAVVSNLWDECGRGKLANFHTYWLRRLLEQTDDWEQLRVYRATTRPWITQITTNVLNVLLTRPGARLMAYGSFLINESWVAPHFADVLSGLRRGGLDDEDITVYFDAHSTIDPRHTEELLEAIEFQTPALSADQTHQIAKGANMAVAASVAQYDRMQAYLSGTIFSV